MEKSHGLDGLRTNLVLESERPDDLTVLHDHKDRRAPLSPRLKFSRELGGLGKIKLTKQGRPTDGDGRPVDLGEHSSAGQRTEP